jgi:hypothetical protein
VAKPLLATKGWRRSEGDLWGIRDQILCCCPWGEFQS